jgi:hypothetical protein
MLCIFLADFSRDFGILCTFLLILWYLLYLCSFKFLCFLEYWNIWWLEFFLRYCACKSYFVCVLGWFWYIWVIWIAIFAFVILVHPIDSCHNNTFFLGLTWSNISLWCYFWKYFCLNVFRNMSFSSSQHNIWQMDPLENWLLLKSDVQIPKVSGLRWAFSPSSCRAFRSIPLDLYQLEVQWWISSLILQTSCLEDVNLQITSFRLCKIKRLKIFQSMVPDFGN